jgi:hypothetical protein
MGVGYYRNFTLWHNGSNPWGCSDYQDDLSIITSIDNGFGFRTDDYSNNVSGGATQANFANNRFLINGVIEKITDKDVFKFTMPIQGLFHLDANPFSVGSGDNGSNLDVKIELLASGQNILGTYNPDLTLNATIDTMLNAGTYFLRVQSMGNIYAPDYASLGSYDLAASYTPITVLPLHRLELEGSNSNGKHKLNWIIEADETLTQQLLEVSYDGRNFQPLNSLNSSARSYTNMPGSNGILYYRLNVTFDNAKQYFSNIVALRNTTNKPSIINSLVHNSAQVNSPSMFAYTIVDYSGRAVAKGNLLEGINNITTANLGSGMYMIQFSNGQEQYAEKIMKQ